ncbi:MAG: transcriptional repressor [Lachnospiraceae bacterium]|nr:transcriptional repressor [Lachnospiraceae bacterium]
MAPKYKTKQREELISYLKNTSGSHFTAGDVCECFKNNGNPIGTATVYRHLEKMVDEGIVRKYIMDNTTSACFEYVGDANKCAENKCFHCKCEVCGKLLHVHCDVLSNIEEHLFEHHNFSLNPLRTIFYGICEDCKKKNEG